jgi:hypothetical protein
LTAGEDRAKEKVILAYLREKQLSPGGKSNRKIDRF